jgi:hypothetical protein
MTQPSTFPDVLTEIRNEDPDGLGGYSFDAPLAPRDELWNQAVNRCLGQ